MARRRWRGGFLAVVLLGAGLVAGGAPGRPAQGATLPPGFTSTPVFSGLTLPTSVAFSPDGKVYVAQKNGLIRVYASASTNTSVTFRDLRTRTYNNYDRGMLGLTVDPRLGDGSGHDFVYVLYAKDAPPGQSPPVWNDGCPSPPGPHTDGCVVSGVLSRIPVNANGTAGTEQILIDNQWCQQFTSHSVGHLAFGSDGYLYVSGGEGASYQNVDWGQFGGSLTNTPTPANPCGDPPGGVGTRNTSPTARGGAMRAQSPRRPAGEARTLSGAVLRVDPDTGAGVPGNPLYNAAAPSSNASRILAYGMRNPYRFTMRGTNEIWVGDVGAGAYEEIDRITSRTPTRAFNFGWPCLEAGTQRGGFRDLDQCRALYADTVDPPTAPYFAYEHFVRINANDTCGVSDGAAISGLDFYTGTRYPAQYRNALFFGDYTRNCLWVMTPGTNGLPDPSTLRTFIDDADNPFPVSIESDPVSGDLFYVNIVAGTVNRISYASTNQPPNASATATPTSGNAPLAVRFDGRGSSDPEGQALVYSWDTDGNGTFGDATGATPTVTYSSGGTFSARLLVTDSGGLADTSAAIPITVTNVAGPTNTAPPVVSGTATVGQTLSSTTGTWSGTAPITYARQWQRCVGGSCSDISGATGSSYLAQLADADQYLRVRVTATNAGGSTSAVSASVGPVGGGQSNGPPEPVIDSPAAGFTWRAGDTISFSGHATDPQDGTVPASRLSWSIVLGHCSTLGCHQHPVATMPRVTSGTVAAPDHEAPAYLELTLTATDAVGASANVTRRLEPRTSTLTFASDPPGVPLTVGVGDTTPAPFSQTWVVNSQVQVIAPTSTSILNRPFGFAGWSDDGAATHVLKVPATNRTYTASYLAKSSGYVVDGYGGLHSVGGAPAPSAGPSWPGWDIARGVARRVGGGGVVVDGFGGLHRFRTGGVRPAAVSGGPYWPGWDIARGVAVLPDGSGGYVLDGFGGLHPFAIGSGRRPPAARTGAYWPGWDIARGVTFTRAGTGGYVVDAYGGLHRFAVGSNPLPPPPVAGPYWPGLDRARGVAMSADGTGGYVLDGFGVIHRFSVSRRPLRLTGPTWPGWDIARGLGL